MSKLQSRVLVGGVLLVLAQLQYFIMQLIVAAGWSAPPYSWTQNYISDLGNTECGPFTIRGHTSTVCSPRHAWMNASFIALGLLVIAAGLLLWHWWPCRRVARIGLVLWVVAGIGKVIVGLVPENRNLAVHSLGALNLPIGAISILLLSWSVLPGRPPLAWFGFLCGVIGLAGFIAFLVVQAGSANRVGLVERIAAYPGNFWFLIIGILAIWSTSPADQPHPQ